MPVKLDLGEFPNNKSIGRIHTTIGELEIFSINIGGQIALNRELGEPLRKCAPLDFVRHFIRYTCFPADTVKDGKVPSTNKRLSFEDILKLPDNELEAIAELYIKGNEYLFRKQKINKKIIDGKEVIAVEPGELKCIKNDNENNKEYLLKLLINEEDEIKTSFEKAFDGINSFSKNLSNQIKNTLAFGESIKKSIGSNTLKPKDFYLPITPKLPEIHLTSQEHFLSKISSILNKLFNVSAQSNKFLIEANKNQMEIAGEIKASSDSASKLSRKNIKLTVAVILIAILSPVLVYWRSCIDGRMQRSLNQKNTNSIIGELTKINDNLVDAKMDKYSLIKSRINELENKIIELNKIIEQQNVELDKIKMQNIAAKK